METKRLIQLILTGKLSPVGTASLLMNQFANSELEEAKEIVESLTSDNAHLVYEVLMLYPKTDFGWSLLPEQRRDCDVASLTERERQDFADRQYVEHREMIEWLRQLLQIQMNKNPLAQLHKER